MFATICMFISKYVEHKLEERGLPADTAEYMEMKDIDPETHMFNMFEPDIQFGSHEKSTEEAAYEESEKEDCIEKDKTDTDTVE